MKKLAILVTTYAPAHGDLRIRAAKRSLESWKEHLKFSGALHVHVADDGSYPELDYGETFWRELIGDWATVSFSRQERIGLGASLNAGLAACKEITPFMLYAMDDWSLVAALDIDPWVQILEDNADVGCIRMGQPSGAVKGGRGRRFGLHVTVSFERYAFYWSLVPALYHQRFFDSYGPLPHGSPALMEKEYNANICRREGPAVLVAMLMPWQHLWSIKTGDVEPGQDVPRERTNGVLSTKGYMNA
ncbi:hypothetical protein LCGC14_2202080 [marine sediment metagenome]|uniref:Glycosyltransferase 2-like domain-containing protein n=1 Tax=marine sediment metagenome TaxID=412755 RepID=A0A0F9GCB3_9ZZZZ